ncbi:hypothetical protein AP75_13150 [Kaistella haifensis DSM 19056]|uniref:HNH nuclease domain-containing protein n=1 Tax=Kaistella haifensis DSM 19056 TaxID=1450526 RepID=A0A246B6R1_9FLAO|nr:hypothetical protein [Kaistella haifensis]OWK97073.1 hypothetical protein AP75_13150 [Kaistella haifensis DSM 19056]
MKEFRYHPEIKGLKVNEDGSEVLMNEHPVSLKIRNRGKHPFKFFYYKDIQIGLAKLVLECWSGMAPEPRLTAKHIDCDYTNYHYTNLRWGASGGNSKFPPKVDEETRNKIIEKLETNSNITLIAKEFGVSDTLIRRLKNKRELYGE